MSAPYDDADFALDFGGGYRGMFMGWHPDRDLNPQYEGIEDVERYTLLLRHPDARDPSQFHESGLTLDSPTARRLEPGKPMWQVHSWDPFHVEPSILCTLGKGGCGAHGFIRGGRWEGA